ncbi:reverse transcriptase domain-containing protein [Tanacetum coccineum]
MLTKPEKTGRMAKWAIELEEHDIVFLGRNEKETPTDFLVEIPFEDNERKEKPKELPYSNSKWRLYIDEASNSDGSGVGLMLIDPEGKEYTYALRFEFETTNNEAEYEALLAVEHICKNQNKKADALSKLASMTFKHLTKEVLVEVLTKREVSKAIQDCEKCKAQSAIRKAETSGAISARCTWPFSHWGIHILGPLPMAPGGLQFLAITVEHSIKTLPRNSQKYTPFSLSYGSEAMIPIIETTDDRGRVQKATKGKESKEGLRSKRHITETSLYIINEVYKEELYTVVDAADHSLVKTTKGTSLHREGFTRSAGGDIRFEDKAKDGVAFQEEGTGI